VTGNVQRRFCYSQIGGDDDSATRSVLMERGTEKPPDQVVGPCTRGKDRSTRLRYELKWHVGDLSAEQPKRKWVIYSGWCSPTLQKLSSFILSNINTRAKRLWMWKQEGDSLKRSSWGRASSSAWQYSKLGDTFFKRNSLALTWWCISHPGQIIWSPHFSPKCRANLHSRLWEYLIHSNHLAFKFIH